MSETAFRRYRELVRELWVARVLAGGDLAQDEEADRAEELDDCWNGLSVEEQAKIEDELRQSPDALKPRPVLAPTELPPRPGA